MFSLRKLVVAAGLMAGCVLGQPALTTIQDILYRADGTRFAGTLFITYNSFQAGDTSNIATSNLTLQIVNGVLRVQLVPTTTASAGAQYSVRYNARGINQFTEIWAVPPSNVTLRVRDVRVATGTIVGPPPVIAPVQISDVSGLQNELAVRPMRGVGFGIGRTAIINQAGQIDAAAGSLSDCMHVDGSSGPCGSGSTGTGGGPTFSDSEVPTGAVNGVNLNFTLANTPSPAASLEIYRNGLLDRQGSDYSLTGNAITFFVASAPQTGDLLLAYYRYVPAISNLLTSASPQVICSTAGTSTTSSALQPLGSCTLPGGLLQAGDRIEVQYQYGHIGSATGFSAEVHIGGTVVVSRGSGGLPETVFAGHSSFGIYSGGQVWDTQSWGATAFAMQSIAGQSSENTGQDLTIRFFGQVTVAVGDSVILRNMTVVRYPAQTNP